MNKRTPIIFCFLFQLAILGLQGQASSSFAPAPAAPACSDTFPFIRHEVLTDEHGRATNVVKFWIQWDQEPSKKSASSPSLCYPNPPSGASMGKSPKLAVDSLAAWKRFWFLSDGYHLAQNDFVSGSKDTIYHTFTNEGNHWAALRVTPTYSGTDDPPLRTVDFVPIDTVFKTLPADIEVLDRQDSVFTYQDSLIDLKLTPHYRAFSVADTVYTAISIRYSGTNDDLDTGFVKFVLPKNTTGDDIEYMRLQNQSTSGKFYFKRLTYGGLHSIVNTNDSKFWEWGVKPDSDEIVTFLVRFPISDPNLDPQVDSSLLLHAESNWLYKSDKQTAPPHAEIQCLITSSVQDTPQEFQDKCPTVVSKSGRDEIAEFEAALSIIRDPNDITVDKKIISPDAWSPRLKYTLYFENTGNGFVRDSVVTRQKVSHFLSPASYALNDYEPKRNGAYGLTTYWHGGGDSLSHKLTAPPSISVLAPVDTLLNPDDEGTAGFFQYYFSVDPAVIRAEGDTILASGEVQMDSYEKVGLGYAPTVFKKAPPIRLPWHIGLKAGYNTGVDSVGELSHIRGFHLGLTLRKNITPFEKQYYYYEKVPDYFSVSDLPKLWFQGELLFSSNSFTIPPETDAYSYAYLTIPLQLRYVYKGYASVSAGYEVALQLFARKNSVSESLPQSFTDRIDRGYFIDGCFGNILGRKGLSIGYRFHNKTGVYSSTRHTYSFHQIYLHYNLK